MTKQNLLSKRDTYMSFEMLVGCSVSLAGVAFLGCTIRSHWSDNAQGMIMLAQKEERLGLQITGENVKLTTPITQINAYNTPPETPFSILKEAIYNSAGKHGSQVEILTQAMQAVQKTNKNDLFVDIDFAAGQTKIYTENNDAYSLDKSNLIKTINFKPLYPTNSSLPKPGYTILAPR